MTDAAFMLAVLQIFPNQWISQATLHAVSQAERGHGATWHSRASDLRNQGHTIENKVVRGRDNGRAVSFYRLVQLPVGAAAHDGNPGRPGLPGFPTAAAPNGTAAPLDQSALFEAEVSEARKFVEGHAWEYQQRDAEQRRHG